MSNRSYLLPFLILLILGCTDEALQEPDYQPVDPVTRPWTRWWWQGSSVTEAGITKELVALKNAGFGGVEITPIYGVIGDEENFIPFLSGEWVQRLEFTLQEATRLGMGVDMATGTGWPFGGPWVSPENACKYVAHKIYHLNQGQTLQEPVHYIQEPVLRSVNNQVYQLYGLLADKGEKPTGSMAHPDLLSGVKALKMEDLKDPITENSDLQGLALDQVRFAKPLPLITLVAYSLEGEVIDLTGKVSKDGELDWVAPQGAWTLYALFSGWHGKMVERAAPGGEGNVIDHFSHAAIQDYLSRFDQAFAGLSLHGLRAYFNDSYEVDDARGQADWTPEFLTAFANKRGYRLQDHLPAFLGLDEASQNARIRSDYRQTMGELLLETFTSDWRIWAHDQHKIIRNQAHGSPANILDLYAASDIPETEGTDIIRSKMASSAAHLSGKKLTSAEAATWLDEHFLTTLDQLKENIDRYFQAGINHVCYHGTCYSPAQDTWPGRLFYAAIHANDRNPWWQDLGALNAYVQRCQSQLQAGSPDNDVLLYFPYFDRLADEEGGPLAHFDGAAQAASLHSFRSLADSLYAQGFAFDVVSDGMITKAKVRQGQLMLGGNPYGVIVIPTTHYLPGQTLEHLMELADQGVRVLFDQKMPDDVPGWGNLTQRQARFAELKRKAAQSAQMSVSLDLISDLGQSAVRKEHLFDSGLQAIRRRVGDQTIYLVTNWSGRDFDGWLPLATSGRSVIVQDPWSDLAGQALLRRSGDRQLEVQLSIPHGETRILQVDPRVHRTVAWLEYEPGDISIGLEGPWTLEFERGGPQLPANQTLTTLISWTDLPGKEYASFSGSGKYATHFRLPEGQPDAWRLRLGQVANSAVVRLNGQKLGTLIGPTYRLDIPADAFLADNELVIEVTNRMANRIIDLNRNHLFWKRFYNVNFPARRPENRGKDGLFTAEEWKPLPSGLLGPVALIPLRKREMN